MFNFIVTEFNQFINTNNEIVCNHTKVGEGGLFHDKKEILSNPILDRSER